MHSLPLGLCPVHSTLCQGEYIISLHQVHGKVTVTKARGRGFWNIKWMLSKWLRPLRIAMIGQLNQEFWILLSSYFDTIHYGFIYWYFNAAAHRLAKFGYSRHMDFEWVVIGGDQSFVILFFFIFVKKNAGFVLFASIYFFSQKKKKKRHEEDKGMSLFLLFLLVGTHQVHVWW